MHKLGVGLAVLIHFRCEMNYQGYKNHKFRSLLVAFVPLLCGWSWPSFCFQLVGTMLRELFLPVAFPRHFRSMTFCFSMKAKWFFKVSKHYGKDSYWAVIFQFEESFLYIKQLKSWYIVSELTVFVTSTKSLVCALIPCLSYCNTICFSVKKKKNLKKPIIVSLHEYLAGTLLQRYFFPRELLSMLPLRCLKMLLENNRL